MGVPVAPVWRGHRGIRSLFKKQRQVALVYLSRCKMQSPGIELSYFRACYPSYPILSPLRSAGFSSGAILWSILKPRSKCNTRTELADKGSEKAPPTEQNSKWRLSLDFSDWNHGEPPAFGPEGCWGRGSQRCEEPAGFLTQPGLRCSKASGSPNGGKRCQDGKEKAMAFSRKQPCLLHWGGELGQCLCLSGKALGSHCPSLLPSRSEAGENLAHRRPHISTYPSWRPFIKHLWYGRHAVRCF